MQHIKDRLKLGIFITAIILPCMLIVEKCKAQTKLPVDENGNISFDSIVVVDPNLTAQKIYGKALTWFAVNFRSPKDAIKMQIPENAFISAYAVTSLQWPTMGKGYTDSKLHFKITIQCKDGKYQYKISDLEYLDNSYRSYPNIISLYQKKENKGAERGRLKIIESINSVVSSLYTEITKKDNW